MVKTVLVVLTDNFDDMMFLGSQVILEEQGFDVIVSSVKNGTSKGQDSSVMTVSLEEAINHNDHYDGMILIEGSDLTDWTYFRNILSSFVQQKRLIGFSRSATNIMQLFETNMDLSSAEVITKDNFVYLGDISKSEEFVEQFSAILSSL